MKSTSLLFSATHSTYIWLWTQMQTRTFKPHNLTQLWGRCPNDSEYVQFSSDSPEEHKMQKFSPRILRSLKIHLRIPELCLGKADLVCRHCLRRFSVIGILKRNIGYIFMISLDWPFDSFLLKNGGFQTLDCDCVRNPFYIITQYMHIQI